MAITIDVKKTLAVKKKFVVNGEEYDSLDQVPVEYRGAIEQALASRAPATTISFNGKQISRTEELPPPFRLIIGGLLENAAKSATEAKRPQVDDESWSQPAALRPAPILGTKAILFIISLAGLVFWLVSALR